ncbi:hypothetical protein JWJ90_22910, partial [Desulfobulbus rhabdoformis]|uniref:hypothetical protein n=1 Tax=Desulfobulbus rhabdoformis TaxID=34032 RepID=UPI00196622A1
SESLVQNNSGASGFFLRMVKLPPQVPPHGKFINATGSKRAWLGIAQLSSPFNCQFTEFASSFVA